MKAVLDQKNLQKWYFFSESFAKNKKLIPRYTFGVKRDVEIVFYKLHNLCNATNYIISVTLSSVFTSKGLYKYTEKRVYKIPRSLTLLCLTETAAHSNNTYVE